MMRPDPNLLLEFNRRQAEAERTYNGFLNLVNPLSRIPIFPDLDMSITRLLLIGVFFLPALYLIIIDARDGKRSRLYRLIAGTCAGAIFLVSGLIFYLWLGGDTGGLESSIAVGFATVWIVQIIIMPLTVIVWLLFAFSLAKKLTKTTQTQPISNQHSTVHPKTWLVSGFFIALIFLTIYFGWQNSTTKSFEFNPLQILSGFLSSNKTNIPDNQKLSAKTPNAKTADPKTEIYTNSQFNFSFNYPETLNLYYVNEEKNGDNLLRIFFESREKSELPTDYQKQNNLGQSFLGGFFGSLPFPSFFSNYYNRDVRPVVYSLTLYLKSKDRSQSLYQVSEFVKSEFCQDKTFSLGDLKKDSQPGFKITCGRYDLYLFADPGEPRQYFVLSSRLSSLIPEELKMAKASELDQVSATIIQSLTFVDPLQKWVNYKNNFLGVSYSYPKSWKNREVCGGSLAGEASFSAEASPSARIEGPPCSETHLVQLLSPGYFTQTEKGLFQVEVNGTTCSAYLKGGSRIFVDGLPAQVTQQENKKIIGLQAFGRCYMVTLQSRSDSVWQDTLEQVLSTLKFL